MVKASPILLLIICLVSCSGVEKGYKVLDLKAFEITVPQNWHYIKEDGIDSFVGYIQINKHSSFAFDFSNMGYAGDLLQTDDEYIKSKKWLPYSPFSEEGVVYTSATNLKQAKADEMKARGITDSSLIKVEPMQVPDIQTYKPNKKDLKKYPNADYIAKLTYQAKSTVIPITLPDEIRSHHIKIDTTNQYVIKTIWPKIVGQGITGIHIQSRTSSLDFNLYSRSLSAQNQALALKAFKTIKIKK
jgi:hypothetical protein